MAEQLYIPGVHETQLTVRAVVVGCFLGIITSTINVYFALQTGFSMPGSLLAALVGYAIFMKIPLRKPYSILENNITQTVGSAASGMAVAAGLASIIPGMKLLGYSLSLSHLYLWAFSVSFLGIFFVVPLRERMIVKEKLRFPTGSATAEAILALHDISGDSLQRARILGITTALAAVFLLLSYFIAPLAELKIFDYIGFGVLSLWTFSLLTNPMFIGAGILMGFMPGISLALGAIIGWGLVGPWVMHMGWTSHNVMSYEGGVHGWLLWPGVVLMVANALTALLLKERFFIYRLLAQKTPNALPVEDVTLSARTQQGIPPFWLLIGLLLASAATIYTMQVIFHVPFYLSILAIVISSLLAVIATRSLGETDINPIGAMGPISQLAFGLVAPGMLHTNLICAGVTCAGSASAGDMMQDLKTGYLLGASPRKQFIAQCWGIVAGLSFCVPIYVLFDKAYNIGQGKMPAPTAHTWSAMSRLLSMGTAGLPPHAGIAMIIAALFGISLAFLREVKAIARFVPSGLAMGIAFIIPASISVSMFVGSCVWVLWQRLGVRSAQSFGYVTAAGLIVGSGLMGIVQAVLVLYNVNPWIA